MVAVVPGLVPRKNATQPPTPRAIICAFRRWPADRPYRCQPAGVRLGVIPAGPVRVGGCDGVGSGGAGAVYQEHSFGVTGQDDGQGVLNDGDVVPGPAASDQETERLAHGWLLLHQRVGLIR